MVNSNTIIMASAILVGLIFTGLPCLEAQSPVGAPRTAPTMSSGAPPAMAPAPDCMTALTNVSDCLTFVQTGSNLTTPDKGCCPEFAGLLESQPICLCSLIGSAESFGVDINRALMLPDACKLQVPSLNACPASPMSAPTPSSSSTAAPSDAPSDTPTGSTAGGPAAAGPDGGAAMTPSASGNGGSNGASSTAVHDISTLFCLAAAIFIAYYF